jgi:hypothetical protein
MPQRPIDPDQEPITEFLDRLVNGAQVSRRTVLQRFAAAGLTAGSASAFLAACGGVEGTNENKKTVDTSNVSHPKTSVGTVTFSNWPLYIDEKVIPPWEKETGGKLKYIEDYNDNEEFYAKVRQELEQSKPIGRELVAAPTVSPAAANRWSTLRREIGSPATSRSRNCSMDSSRGSVPGSCGCRVIPCLLGDDEGVLRVPDDRHAAAWADGLQARARVLREHLDVVPTIRANDVLP